MKKAKAVMYRNCWGEIEVDDDQPMLDAFNFAFGKITTKKIKVEIKGYRNKIIIKKEVK